MRSVTILAQMVHKVSMDVRIESVGQDVVVTHVIGDLFILWREVFLWDKVGCISLS
jgi:hypothetical protein